MGQRDEAFPNLVFGPDVKPPRQFLGAALEGSPSLTGRLPNGGLLEGRLLRGDAKSLPKARALETTRRC